MGLVGRDRCYTEGSILYIAPSLGRHTGIAARITRTTMKSRVWQACLSEFRIVSFCRSIGFSFSSLRSNQTFDGYDYSRCPATRAGLIIPYVLVNVVWFHAAFVISGSLMVGLVRDSRSWSVLGLIVSVCDLLLTFSGFFV